MSVLPQEMARGLKFRILEGEEVNIQCSGKKGADHLRGHSAADLCLCFAYAKSRFSDDVAQLFFLTQDCETNQIRTKKCQLWKKSE